MTHGSGAQHPVARWIAAGALDPELGGLLWLLVEARVPVVVAGPPETDRGGLREALAGFLPPDVVTRRLDGAREDFAWMPEAVELGWRREGRQGAGGQGAGRSRPSAGSTILMADLEDDPDGTWGERARIALRSLSVGYGMLATVPGSRLEDVFDALTAAPVGATEDELARLGAVLVLDRDGAMDRVIAAHYLRPTARDLHGHVQRMPPAVVATWDPANQRFEHFAWGITAELSDRIGTRPADLEREQARRAETLAGESRTFDAPSTR
jgi:hypothetical protein